MNATSCACVGIRSCALCESRGDKDKETTDLSTQRVLYYCCRCGGCHLTLSGDCTEQQVVADFSGITVYEEFVTHEEEKSIIYKINSNSWTLSQSGRRKQDFGPKVNFKKRKVKLGNFTGLPELSRDLYGRMASLGGLRDFCPIEQCHLEYDPQRGAAIDPHFDDFWIWGERLVTLSLLSATFLTFSKPSSSTDNLLIKVLMRPRSLLVVAGAARHVYQHSIVREDVADRRLAITFREFSTTFLNDEAFSDMRNEITRLSLNFEGSVC